jgi:hypothetical protein
LALASILGLGALLAVGPGWIPPRWLADRVESSVQPSLQTPLRIDRVRLGWVRARIEGLALGPDGRWLRVPNAELRWRPWHLLWGQASVAKLRIDRARLRLEQDAAGRWNWSGLVATSTPSSPRGPFRLPVAIEWSAVELVDLDVEVRRPGVRGAAPRLGLRSTGRIARDGQATIAVDVDPSHYAVEAGGEARPRGTVEASAEADLDLGQEALRFLRLSAVAEGKPEHRVAIELSASPAESRLAGRLEARLHESRASVRVDAQAIRELLVQRLGGWLGGAWADRWGVASSDAAPAARIDVDARVELRHLDPWVEGAALRGRVDVLGLRADLQNLAGQGRIDVEGLAVQTASLDLEAVDGQMVVGGDASDWRWSATATIAAARVDSRRVRDLKLEAESRGGGGRAVSTATVALRRFEADGWTASDAEVRLRTKGPEPWAEGEAPRRAGLEATVDRLTGPGVSLGDLSSSLQLQSQGWRTVPADPHRLQGILRVADARAEGAEATDGRLEWDLALSDPRRPSASGTGTVVVAGEVLRLGAWTLLAPRVRVGVRAGGGRWRDPGDWLDAPGSLRFGAELQGIDPAPALSVPSTHLDGTIDWGPGPDRIRLQLRHPRTRATVSSQLQGNLLRPDGGRWSVRVETDQLESEVRPWLANWGADPGSVRGSLSTTATASWVGDWSRIGAGMTELQARLQPRDASWDGSWGVTSMRGDARLRWQRRASSVDVDLEAERIRGAGNEVRGPALRGTVDATPDTTRLDLSAGLRDGRWGARPLPSLRSSLRASRDRGTIRIDELRVVLPETESEVALGGRLRRDAAGALMPDLHLRARSQLPLRPEGPTEGYGEVELRVVPQRPTRWQVEGTVRLRDVSAHGENLDWEGLQGSFPFEQTVVLPEPPAASRFGAVPWLGDWPDRARELASRLARAKLAVSPANILAVAPQPADYQALRPYRLPVGHVLSARRLRLGRTELERVQMEARWRQGMLLVDRWSFEVWEGDVLADLAIQLTADQNLRGRIRGTGTSLNLDVPYAAVVGRDPEPDPEGTGAHTTSAVMDLRFGARERSLAGTIDLLRVTEPMLRRAFGALELESAQRALDVLEFSERVGVRPTRGKIWIANNLLSAEFDWQRLWLHVAYKSAWPWDILLDTFLIVGRTVTVPTLGASIVNIVNSAVRRFSIGAILVRVLDDSGLRSALGVIAEYVTLDDESEATAAAPGLSPPPGSF